MGESVGEVAGVGHGLQDIQGGSPQVSDEDVLGLPQLGPQAGTWHLYVHRLRVWTPRQDGIHAGLPAEDARQQVRPWLLFVVSVGDGRFIKARDVTNVLQQETKPSAAQVEAFLKGVMASPLLLTGGPSGGSTSTEPGRPVACYFADTYTADFNRSWPEAWDGEERCAYVGALRDRLQALGGIKTGFRPVPRQLLAIVRQGIEGNLQRSMGGGELQVATLPGLRSTRGCSERFTSGLFLAAARFLGSKPWEVFSPTDVILVKYTIAEDESTGQRLVLPGYCTLVKEEEGVEEPKYGLAFFRSMEDAEMYLHQVVHAGAEGLQVNRAKGADGGWGWSSCTFVPDNDLPLEDLDEVMHFREQRLGGKIMDTLGGGGAAAEAGAASPALAGLGDLSPEEREAHVRDMVEELLQPKIVERSGLHPLLLSMELQPPQSHSQPPTLNLNRPNLLVQQWFEVAMQAIATLVAEKKHEEEANAHNRDGVDAREHCFKIETQAPMTGAQIYEVLVRWPAETPEAGEEGVNGLQHVSGAGPTLVDESAYL